MKVTITTTQQVDIERSQQREITLKYLEDRYNLHRHMWITSGNLYEEKEYSGNKKFYDTELIRPATEVDIAVLRTIKEIERG